MTEFSTTSKRDLLRYLTALDEVVENKEHGDADDVAELLGMDRETAARTERRLKTLGYVKVWHGPTRVGDPLQHILTKAGVTAVLNGDLEI